MSKFQLKVIKNKALDSTIQEQIVALHQKFFDISREKIIEYLLRRDEIHLYFDKISGNLIGTLGCQWFVWDKFVVLYIGNTVIDSDYQKSGILSNSIWNILCKTFMNYPFKEKAVISLSSTPNSCGYFCKFPHSWPRKEQSLPCEIVTKMEQFCSVYCDNDYQINNNTITINSKENQVKICAEEMTKIIAANDPHSLWFKNINPGFIDGSQVLNYVPLSLNSVMKMSGVYLKRKKKRA